MEQLEGKTALVTGGASGIGLAMVRSFIKAGMNVVIVDFNEPQIEAAKLEFPADRCMALLLDVRDREGYASAAKQVASRFGNLHVLCNNAGVGRGGTVDEASWEDWDWNISINLVGVVNGIQTFIRSMIAHGEGGHVVNTASLAGVLPVNSQPLYNTTKYAVVGLSESMRKDLADDNIGVTVLCPGFVATNIFGPGSATPKASDPADVSAESPQRKGLTAEQMQTRQQLTSGAIDPAIVGEMVLAAIRNNLPYVFTHPEFGSYVERRGLRLKKGFEDSAQLRAQVEADLAST